MTKVYSGGCQCGEVKYEISSDPLLTYACHCSVCQTQSGSAFGLAAVFQKDDLVLSGARPSHFIREGQERSVRCFYCQQCGTRLYHQWFTSEGDLPFVNLKAGTLIDTSWFLPGCHIWTSKALPWIRFTKEDIVFPQQPNVSEMPSFNGNPRD